MEAENEAERLRSEFVLAIYLLGQNYDLSPDNYSALFNLASGDPALKVMQRAFHEMALEHIRAYDSHSVYHPKTETEDRETWGSLLPHGSLSRHQSVRHVT